MRDVELQEVFKDLASVKSHHQDQMNSIDRELQVQKSLMKDLQQQLLTSTTTLEQALLRETKLTREITDIKTRLGEKVMLLSRIEKELIDSKTHLTTTTTLLSSREKELNHLKEERDRVHEHCFQMEQQLSNLTEETSHSIQSLQTKLIQLEEENILLQTSIVPSLEQKQRNQSNTLISSPLPQVCSSQESISSRIFPDMNQNRMYPTDDISNLDINSSTPVLFYCDYCESSTHKTVDCDRQDEIW